MKQILIDMINQGTLDRILSKWQPPKADCEPLRRSGQSLPIEKLISLFVIVIFGLILAAITFILEIVYFEFIKSQAYGPWVLSRPTRPRPEKKLPSLDKLKSVLEIVNVRLDTNCSVEISLIKEISNIYTEIISRDRLNYQNLVDTSNVSTNQKFSKHSLAQVQ